jgi:bifunctional non-homologous end joining protein LigD
MKRKQALLDLLGENDVELPVLYSEHLTGDGQEMFEHAAKLSWEGIISKRADAPYRSGRNESWLKIKAVQKGKFPVLDSLRIPRVSPHSTWESEKARNSSTWER